MNWIEIENEKEIIRLLNLIESDNLEFYQARQNEYLMNNINVTSSNYTPRDIQKELVPNVVFKSKPIKGVILELQSFR